MHHDSPETTSQVVEKLRQLFQELHEEDQSKLPLDIANSIKYTTTEGLISTYQISYDGATFKIEMTEAEIEGFLSGDEYQTEYVNNCMYAIMCDFEDGILFGTYTYKNEVDLTA